MCNYLTLATWLLRGRQWEKFDTDVGQVLREVKLGASWYMSCWLGIKVVISSLQAAAASLGLSKQRGNRSRATSSCLGHPRLSLQGTFFKGEPVSSAPSWTALACVQLTCISPYPRLRFARGKTDQPTWWVWRCVSVVHVQGCRSFCVYRLIWWYQQGDVARGPFTL